MASMTRADQWDSVLPVRIRGLTRVGTLFDRARATPHRQDAATRTVPTPGIFIDRLC